MSDTDQRFYNREDNKIIFRRDTTRNPLPVLAALHDIVHLRGYKNVVIDFSNTVNLRAESILPIAAIARAYRSENIDFDITCPEDTKAYGLLRNTGWLHLISPERYPPPKKSLSNTHLPALIFQSSSEHHEIIDQCMDIILSTSQISRDSLRAIEWSLNEITDNVLCHSQSPYGGILQVFTFPNRIIDFYVVDSGVSIPKTLKNSIKEIKKDADLLQCAIQEGVTRDKENHQGNGLFGTYKCCSMSGGSLKILSGCADLTAHGNDSVRIKNNHIPFNGTFIKASIKYSSPNLLEKALFFNGKKYVPGYDYIDSTYEKETDNFLHFIMKEEVPSFGTRESGQLTRQKILNLMQNYTTSIEFDFQDIALISSSFADEVFGKIYEITGPIHFNKLCKFKNVSNTIRVLLDRSIIQRLRSPSINQNLP